MAAGVQGTRQGWRWSYYTLSIFTGVVLLLFIFFYEETKYIPLYEGHSVDAAVPQVEPDSKQGNSVVTSPTLDEDRPNKNEPRAARLDSAIPLQTWRQRMSFIRRTDEPLWPLFYRPFVILFSFPDVAFAAIQYGAGLCWLVNLSVVVSVTFSYPPYLFTPDDIGYMGVGPFIGNLIGSFYCGYLADRAVVWYAKRHNGWFEPEMRLYLLHLPSFAMGGGIIMFGITAAKGMHWIYPSIGGALFGFGLGSFGDAVLTFVIDGHRMITGEAFVAIAFVRNVFTIIMAQVRAPWEAKMGLQNMFILQGFIALAISLLYLPMIYYGKRARKATSAKYYKLAGNRI